VHFPLFKNILRSIKFVRLIKYKTDKVYKHLYNLPLNQNSITLDLGANVGSVSQFLEDIYNCNIDCYEPNQLAFKILEKRFKKNKKITCYNYAVSETDGFAKLYLHLNYDLDKVNYSNGSSLLIEKENVSKENFEYIQTISIKKLLNSYEKIDLIKIDIEGYEYKILHEILKNKKKIKKVICELHGEPKSKKNKFLNKNYKEFSKHLKELDPDGQWFIFHH
tara:strand:- start:40 stop:702 length:663 start_codon:yes stop_codon:yes gene_type:complete